MSASPITRRQLVRLQTLWSLLMKHVEIGVPMSLLEQQAGGMSHPRDQARLGRLAWVSAQIGRQINSFNDLTRKEAALTIEKIQECLPKELVKRKRPSRDQAHRMGTEGRRSRAQSRGQAPDKLTGPPDAASLETLATLKQRAGFADEQRFAAWLRSRSSPTGGSDRLHTLGKVNAVIWALKRMVRENEKRTAEDAEVAEVPA